MQLNIPHKFTQPEAIEKVKSALVEAGPKLAGKATITQEEWQGNVLTFAFVAEGQNISGTLTVLEHEFDLNVTLPLMLRMFEGKIQQMVSAYAGKMLQ